MTCVNVDILGQVRMTCRRRNFRYPPDETGNGPDRKVTQQEDQPSGKDHLREGQPISISSKHTKGQSVGNDIFQEGQSVENGTHKEGQRVHRVIKEVRVEAGVE